MSFVATGIFQAKESIVFSHTGWFCTNAHALLVRSCRIWGNPRLMEFQPITGFSQSFINSIESSVWMHFIHFTLIRQALNQLEPGAASK